MTKHPRPVLQRKAATSVGAVDDPLEREADRAADAAVAALGSATPQVGVVSPDGGRIRRAAGAHLAGGSMTDAGQRMMDKEIPRGRPLADAQRQPLEAAFGGADFSGVRVHTGAATDRIARSISARAFTTGADVFIRSEDDRPNTRSGQHLLAHELAHTIQQGASTPASARGRIARRTALVQRVAIDSGALVTMFRGITGLGDLFNDDALRANPQGLTVVTQAQRMMGNYEMMFEASAPDDVTANAMKLAAAARTMGAMLARQINNPWAAPELSAKLLAYYAPRLRVRLSNQGVSKVDRAATVRLAKVIASGDPVKMFMTNKVSLGDATRKIQEMAAEANCTAVQMHQHLTQQFQMELASFTSAEIANGTIGEGVVQAQAKLSGESELIGELSTTQFNGLVNQMISHAGRRWAALNGTGTGLDFTAGAAVNLQLLQQSVAAAGPIVAAAVPNNLGPGAAALTDPQKREIGVVQDADAAIAGGRVESEVIEGLKTEFNVDAGGAARLLTMFLDAFRSQPLTTTFWAKDMFAGGVPDALEYQNAMKRELDNVELKDLFPTRSDGVDAAGSVEKIGHANGMAQHRGNANYVRWRYEKDIKPAGYGGLKVDETFEFAAMSPSFASAKGSDTTTKFGESQYGDSHVVYKDDVKDRAVYQFTAKGALRRDPMILLHDIVASTPKAFDDAKTALTVAIANVTNAPNEAAKALLRPAVKTAGDAMEAAKNKANQASNVIKAIFSTMASKKLAFLDQQQIEVRIFGPVSFANDAKELHIGPGNTKAVKDNAKAFAKAKGITYSIVKPTSTTLTALTQPGVSAPLNAEVQQMLTKGSDRKAHAFDALAQVVLNVRTIRNADTGLLQALVTELGTIFNSLGKTRTAARAAMLLQAQNHHPAIVP